MSQPESQPDRQPNAAPHATADPFTTLTAIQTTAHNLLASSPPLPGQAATFVRHMAGTAAHLLGLLDGAPRTPEALQEIIPALGAEFQQPQTALYGYAQLLLLRPGDFGLPALTPDQHQQLTAIHAQGISLSQWTQHVISSAAERRRRATRAPAAPFDLGALLAEQGPLLRYRLRGRAVRVSVTSPDVPLWALARRYHVGALVRHAALIMGQDLIEYGAILLSAQPGPQPGEIAAQLFCTGVRLLPDELEQLFGREGRQLYVQRLHEDGGRLHVLREPGRGATLVVALPSAPSV